MTSSLRQLAIHKQFQCLWGCQQQQTCSEFNLRASEALDLFVFICDSNRLSYMDILLITDKMLWLASIVYQVKYYPIIYPVSRLKIAILSSDSTIP